MREITEAEYRQFLAQNKYVLIEGVKIPLLEGRKGVLFEPQDFRLETTTVWSFENRGKWATHRGDYRGNWAPEILHHYSRRGG